jgi:hypothetical protein
MSDFGRKITVADENGRSITFKSLDVLQRTRLMRACGVAWNITDFQAHALMAAMVCEIDGTPQPASLRTIEHVESAIGRLGDAGFNAVAAYFDRKSAETPADDAEATEGHPAKN